MTEPQRKIERETDLRLKTAGSILRWGFGTCFCCGCACSQSQPIFWGLLVWQIIFAWIAVWRGLSLPWNNMLFKTTRCIKMWLCTPTLGLKANWCVRKKISTQSAKWPMYRVENGYPIHTPSDEWHSNPLIRFGNIVWVTENKQNKIYTINEKGQNKSKRKLNSFIQGWQIRKRTNDKRYPLLVTAVWKTSSHWIKGVVQISPHLTTPQHLRLPPLIYATISCIFFNSSGDKMSKSHCPPQEVRWQNTIRIGAANKVRCNFACDLIATINVKGSSQQVQPIQVRNGAMG